MPINREATIRWKGYDPTDLKSGSNKRVWANCDVCGYGRWVNRYQYRDMCHKCSHSTPEAIEANRQRGIEQFESQEAHDAHSVMRLQYHKDNPEARKIQSRSLIQYYIDNPEVKDDLSKKIRGSPAYRSAMGNQRGGNDLINHHYIYDHNDRSLNTIQITRKDHSRLHQLLKKLKYVIPHINVIEENKYMFKRRDSKPLRI